MAREVLSNGVINPDKYQADWYADLSNNWNLLNNLIGSAISGSEVDSKIATAIQELMIRTFQIVAELPATGTEGVMYLVLIPNTSKYTAYVWENNAYRELGVIQMTITIDDELSTTSENPAQNKVITNALNNKAPISHTHSASDITSGLATVATSGSYNDLSNTPTIPTVNNATLTIQKNGTNVQTFTANQSTNATANITVPTKTSDLTNDSGFITSDNTKIPLAGSNAISGDLIPATDNAYYLGSASNRFKEIYGIIKTGKITHRVDDDLIQIYGGTDETGGAGILLNGKNKALDAGNFRIVARSTSANATLLGTPTALSWGGSTFRPGSDGKATLGTGSIRWGQIYSTNSAITTSDERQKDNIKQIDDTLLQAWENVNIVQFNFKDALEKKGENARLHTGYIAQNIQQACEEKGVNPNDYGLFCFDSWEEQEEKKDENGQVIEPYRAKGDLYSLRYEEALIVECAYLRKCIKELRNEIEELKSSK